jgi:diacylglycerol O-acyltransferase
MQQLNAHDAMFAQFDNENWAAHGGIVGIYDPSTAPGGRVRMRDILDHLERRLSRSPVFRRRLVRVPLDLDHPYWIEDEHFNLEYHVHHIRLPKPADWRQLSIQIARLDSRPLDVNRPPWEMWVIEGLEAVEGIPSGCYAIFTKFHHVAVDGHSMRDIISGIHDLTPEVDQSALADDWKPERPPSARWLLTRAAVNNIVHAPLRTARAAAGAAPPIVRLLPRAVRDGARGRRGPLLPPAVPRTRFQVEISPHRVLDGRTFPLEDIRRIRRVVDGATVNDVIVAIVGGAVRRYLQAKGESTADELICGAPLDLRKGEESTGGNDIAFLFIALGSHIDDPVERLRHVHQSTAGAKEMAHAVGARNLSELSASFPGALNVWGFKALAATQLAFGARRPTFNVGVSNVPGPQVPLYMNGARGVRFFGVAPIFSGTALVVGVFSYCGVIDVTFVSCRRVVPDPGFLAECLQASYADLLAALPGAAERPVSTSRAARNKPIRAPR